MVGGGVEAMKGVYQSIRLAEVLHPFFMSASCLTANFISRVSVWWSMSTSLIHASGTPTTFISLHTNFLERQTRRSFKVIALDVLMGETQRTCQSSSVWLETSSLSSTVVVMVSSNVPRLYHHSITDFSLESKIWTVKQISRLNANEHKFDVTEKATGKTTNMSVREYFMKKYNIYLEQPWLPLVQTQKANVLFPMEVCVMCDGQRYPYKLNPAQVFIAYPSKKTRLIFD